ncbi:MULTISPECIES: ABC-three component system protein [Sphingobacterium]|uniref:ABC-three component system protein n=1 Tax=Sphingobacterium TaxID=28453 RepID=UPI00257E4577|nr:MULTISPECIES: ABC-three component system protein [Sphingobacterium]
MQITFLEITRPKGKRRISTFEILSGAIVSPLDRMKTISEDDFEEMVLEWADDYLSKKYPKVRQLGGAGDKGRDILGFLDDQKFDIYQCKHYATKLAPTDIYKELGKLVYFTFKGDYSIPEKYYFVSPKGVGTTVFDMIQNPSDINQTLADNWDKYCRDDITKKESIILEGDFKTYVKSFNFSILDEIAPHELINQHAETRYHILRFGGGLKKFREIIPEATVEIQPKELVYTSQLFAVYSENIASSISSITELEAASVDLHNHFKEQRKSFYCAETLETFSRENFPEADPLPFEELKDEAYNIATTNLLCAMDKSGLERLLSVTKGVKQQSFASNPLFQEIKVQDKEGICHHLANEGKVQWVKKSR